MARTVFITIHILIAMSIGFLGCQSGMNAVATNSAKRPYDYEANLLHADVSVLPAGRDSLDVFIEWNREECLYLRDRPSSPFFARLSVVIGRSEIAWLDTLSSNIAQEGRKTWRINRLDVGAAWQEGSTTVEASFNDHHRNNNYPWRALIPAWESIAHPHASDGWPLFGQHATNGDTIYFSAPIGSQWQHASVEVPHRLPSPPFTRSKDQTDTLQPNIQSDWEIDASGWSGYVIQPGINILGEPNGVGKIDVAQIIHGVEFDFPHLRDVRLLIASSRYISSRGEFQRMQEASDPKAALDAFWLNCGNNKEAAAELIKIYYSRVEEANRFFFRRRPRLENGSWDGAHRIRNPRQNPSHQRQRVVAVWRRRHSKCHQHALLAQRPSLGSCLLRVGSEHPIPNPLGSHGHQLAQRTNSA